MATLPGLCTLLDDAVAQGWVPGCAARVWRAGSLVHASEHGVLASHPGSPNFARAVTPETIWDLASLTKVCCTTSLVAQALSAGRMSLDEALPDALAVGQVRICLGDLLEHASGLAAHREFFYPPWALEPGQRDQLIAAVREVPPEVPARTRAIYSDLGYLLLGAWLELMHGLPLDRLFTRDLAGPLNLGLSFRPLGVSHELAHVAPTEVYDPSLHGGREQHWYPIRHMVGQRVAHGVAHDDNAVVMGGVAGHAGLFGTADGVLEFARAWLEGRIPGGQLCSHASSVPHSTRRLGFDGPSPGGSTGGALSSAAFGHLGYTGTSLWIDPSNESIYVLLSNRVHPVRENDAIADLRVAFHRTAAPRLRY